MEPLHSVAILAHGKNWEIPVPLNPADIRLSRESRMTAQAAGWLFLAGVGTHIIFSSGFTAGKDHMSEAQAMYEDFRTTSEFDDIPEDAITRDEDSHDTSGNLLVAKHDIMPLFGINKLAPVTVRFHAPRVKYLGWRLRVPMDGVYRSEAVLREKGLLPPRERSLRAVVSTARQYANEGPAWALNIVDPRSAHVAKVVTKTLRNQWQLT